MIPVNSCLTGDRGRCRNAGEEHPLLGQATVDPPLGGILARIAPPGHHTWASVWLSPGETRPSAVFYLVALGYTQISAEEIHD